MSDTPQLLQDHFEDPYHRGLCEAATHAGRLHASASDCQTVCELRLGPDDTVEEVWFDGAGCASCEGVASLLAEYAENRELEELQGLDPQQFFERVGLGNASRPLTACITLPLEALALALRSPLDAVDDEVSDGPNFGGPSLREEC